MSLRLRRYVTAGGVAGLGIGVIVIPPMAPLPPNIPTPVVELTSNDTYVVDSPNHLVGLILGGSGTPIPQLNDDWVAEYDNLYIQRILPGADSEGVFTPEGASPITGVKSLERDPSITQGETMLETYITQNVDAGNTVAVATQSQSSTISSLVMNDLENDGVPAEAVKFVLTGDASNPDGGLAERLGTSFPAFGATYSGFTPPDTIYSTSIYTLEYDGFADFPKYPLNILADLNAVLGEAFVHPTYRLLPPTLIDNAIELPTTADYDGVTSYYMIPDPGMLPLVQPLSVIPVIGKPLADLLAPVLTQLVNLGYDNPDNEGWDVGQANVATTFGVFPSLDQVMTAIKNLGPATEQGINAAMHDISTELSNPSSLFANLASDAETSVPADLLSSPTDFINTLAGAFAQAYSLLLPAADTLTTLAVTVPTSLVDTFVDNLGDPLDAVGLAAGKGIAEITELAGIDLAAVVETVNSILGEFGLSTLSGVGL